MAALIYQAHRSINVLLVEDDPGDVVLVMEVFKSSSRPIRIIRVKDGMEAMNYLKGKGEFADAERPDLVLLDLSIPKKNGFEVLHEIKDDARFNGIPVVIFSHSNLQADIHRAYTERANFYLVKPPDFDGLFEAMRKIEDIWLGNIGRADD